MRDLGKSMRGGNVPIVWLIIIAILLSLGVGLGIGLGVKDSVPITTTAAPTTTTAAPTTTTAAPTTTATPTCPTNYTLLLDTGGTANVYDYYGDYANYYVAGNSFRYYTSNGTVDPNTVLIYVSLDKASGAVLWSHQLCPLGQYMQSIEIDQSNGDSYFAYTCYTDHITYNPLSAFVSRYDIDGNLVWRKNITIINGLTFRYFESPIQLDTVNGKLYVSYSAVSYYGAAAMDITDGTLLWFTPSIGDDVGGISFYAPTQRMYMVTLSLSGSLKQYDTSNGHVVTSVTVDGSTESQALACDSTGNVYLSGAFRNDTVKPATLYKYNALLVQQWNITHGAEYNNADSINTRALLYDPIADILFNTGTVKTYLGANERVWIASFDPLNGSLLSYFEQPDTSPVQRVFPSLIPYYEARTLFYTYENYGSRYNHTLNTFCY